MDKWWYVRKDERIGPVEIEELKNLLQRGSIGTATMVWQEGMESWLPFSEVPALATIKQAVPPPIPHQSEAERIIAMPLASRWPRFFARIFDLWWEALLLSLLTGLVLGRYFAGFVEWIYKPGSSQILGILLIPVSLALDAAVYAVCGNTPGKMLLGIRVRTLRGHRLSFSQYLARNFGIWTAGLGLGIPFVTLITMAHQSGRLGKGQQASYDESNGTRVYGQPLGVLRRGIFIIAFCSLAVVMGALNSMDRDLERERFAATEQKFYVWQNPITKASTSIDARWKFSSQNNPDGHTVYMFTEQVDHALVVFALEQAPGFNLRSYIRAFQSSTSSEMSFSDGGQFSEVGGRPTWLGTGTMKASAGSRLRVRVIQSNTGFWRVVSVQVPPFEYSDTRVNILEKALWDSVSSANEKLAM